MARTGSNYDHGVSSFGVPLLGSTLVGNPFGRVFFVDGNLGSDGRDGRSPAAAYLTMDKAFDNVASGDTIFFRGNITEELSTPAGVFDVTVVGAGNRPRHADAHTSNGGYSAATWKAPASPTAATPLVIVRQQGWTFRNILFDCPVDAAAVQVFRDGGAGDAERDGSHALITGCRFASGQNAIELKGGPNFVQVIGNDFNDMTAGALIVTTGAGIGTNYYTVIEGNRFVNNASHIRMALNKSVVRYNTFGLFTASTGFGVDLTGGIGDNMVHDNYFSGDYDGDYVAAANDSWAANGSMDLASGEVGGTGADVPFTTAVPVA